MQELWWHSPPCAPTTNYSLTSIQTSCRQLPLHATRERRVPHHWTVPRHIHSTYLGLQVQNSQHRKTIVKSLDDIYGEFAPAKAFMSDGGKHFKNNEVHQCCKKWGGRHHVVAAYSPWVNGLVEGIDKILLYVLAWLCALEVGEDGWLVDLPKTWPDHFDKAIQILNWWILLALKFSLKELFLSLIVNTTPTPLEVSSSMPIPQDFGNTHGIHSTAKPRWIFRGGMTCNGPKNKVWQKGIGVKGRRNNIQKIDN